MDASTIVRFAVEALSLVSVVCIGAFGLPVRTRSH
jgi:hypothetical protein